MFAWLISLMSMFAWLISLVSMFQEIMLGESQIALVGGTENMSQAPYAVRNIRFGTRLGADLQVCLHKKIKSQWVSNVDGVNLFFLKLNLSKLPFIEICLAVFENSKTVKIVLYTTKYLSIFLLLTWILKLANSLMLTLCLPIFSDVLCPMLN